jgi:hypothetical protein
MTMSEAKETNDATPEKIWIATYTASQYAGVLSRGLLFRSIHNDEEKAQGMQRDPQAMNFTVTKYVKSKASSGTPLEGTVEHPVEDEGGELVALRAALTAANEQIEAGRVVPEGMQKVSEIIKYFANVLTRFGDSCVYVRTAGCSWGAVALNREHADKLAGDDAPETLVRATMVKHAEYVERMGNIHRDQLFELLKLRPEVLELRGEALILRESEKHRLELIAQFADWEHTLSLAGCVKDATNPCGWRNKRAEEAEAELESLKETVASLGITSREYASHLGPAMMWQNSLWQAAQSELDEANAKIAMLESSSVPQDAVIATVKAIMAEIEEWDEPMTHKEIYKVINNIFPAAPYLEQPKGDS